MEHASELEIELVSLFAQHTALTQRLLTKIREFDERQEWADQGALSCAHWLSWRVGLSLGAAREKVRTARALADLPAINAALGAGQLSYSKARALTRIATDKNEQELLIFAGNATTSQLERFARGWRKIDKSAEDEREWKRTCSVFFAEDDMCVVSAKLRPEEGALLMKALEAARSKGKSLADALVEVARRSLFASEHSSGERYQVIVHNQMDVSAETSERTFKVEGTLGDKIGVSAETSKRLTCDATTVQVLHDKDGAIIDVGRKTRRISTKMRLALTQRDHGCRFPGCTNKFTDAHHVKHWIDGGETKLKNLMLLCGYHHSFIHDRKALLGEDQIFRHKDGTPITNEMPHTSPPASLPSPADMPLPTNQHLDYGFALSGLYSPR